MSETTFNLDQVNLANLTDAVDEDDQVLPPDQVALPATMNEAFKVNPAQHAQDLKLSERADIPVSAVTGANKEIEAGLKLNQIDFTEMSQRSPVTSKFLTDYDNAVVAQNDISLLERIEKTFAGAGRSAVLGFKTQLEGAKLAVLESNYLKNYLDATFKPGSQIKAAIHDVKDDTAESIIAEIKTLQEKRADLTPEDLNLVEQGLRAGLESLINMAPGFAASLITRSPTPMLSAMTVQTTASSFGEARAEGLSSDDAVRKGQIDGAIEGLSELIPAKTLIKLLGGGVGSNFKKGAIKFAAQEIGTEYLAEIGQSLNAYAFGLDKELENAEGPAEIAEIMLRRLAVVTVATMFAGGAQIGTVATINKTVEVLTRETEQKEQKGLNEQEALNQLNQDAAASELRENSPERFHQFVQDADGANETHVFIDGPALAEYLEGQDVGEDAALILLLDKVNEAAMLGADAAIPVADFATVIAGTPHFEALVNHMTLSEETNSPARQDQAKAETQAYIETLMEQAQENVSQYVEAQEVYESIREQLIDSGQVAPEHADTMAKLVPAWATVYAQKNGLTIQEVYDQSGLTIEGPQTGEAARLENEASLLLAQEPIDPQDSYDDPRNEGRGGLALTVRQLDIEAKFQAELDADYDGAIERYEAIEETNGGQIIGGDIFKELSEDYMNDRSLAGAVHGPSAALAKLYYKNSLQEEPREGFESMVQFLAGGTGAGKTSAIKAANKKAGSEITPPQIIMDGNLSKLNNAIKKIDQALAASKPVEITMVYREMIDAFRGTLKRSMDQEALYGSGRTVPFAAHLSTHQGAVETIKALAERYKDNPEVIITVVNNSLGRGNSELSNLELLDNVDYTTGAADLAAELEAQYAEGKISEAVYKGFKGSSGEKVQGGDGTTQSTAVGGQSQQQREGQQGNKLTADTSGAVTLDVANKVAEEGSFKTNRDLKLKLQEMARQHQEDTGVDLNTNDEALAAHLVLDALGALKSNPNAVGWYNETVGAAMAILELIHPEVESDPVSRFAFTFALANTSNGIEVGRNFKLAEKAYRIWKETGDMPTDIGEGKSSSAMNNTMVLFNTMSKDVGFDQMIAVFDGVFTVKQLNLLGYDASGENVDTIVRGAAMMGPKIGNGFYSNLRGMFDQLTMDRWFVRAWERHVGNLVIDRPDMVETKTSQLEGEVKKLKKLSKRVAEWGAIGVNLNETNMEKLAGQILKSSMKEDNRDIMNLTVSGESIRKVGNSLAGYLDGQKEDPANGTERNRMRKVLNMVLDELVVEYPDLNMSDLQAVLWFGEKRLYDKARSAEDVTDGYEDDETPDYANAAAELARSQGITDQAIKEADHDGRTRGTRLRNEEVGQVEGDTGDGGKNAKRERKSFLATNIYSPNRPGPESDGRLSSFKRTGKKTDRTKRGVIQVFEPKKDFINLLEASGMGHTVIHEITPERAGEFVAAIEESKSSIEHGAAIFVYPAETVGEDIGYNDMRLFLSPDAKSGFAVKPDGDIVSVFSNGGGKVTGMLQLAVEFGGGTKLDAFDTVLPRFYNIAGFEEYKRETWLDEFTPEGWDKDTFKAYNNGEPDVVYMRYVPPEGTVLEQEGDTTARGYYDPENVTIRLTEAADLSTFLHEFAHFMLEMERSAGGETLTSINNWFKRNADSVAAEANEYLDDIASEELEQSAFHGSPTLFDKFRLAFMGKGEGNQAFGWGLYFAGNRKIGEHYRDTLGDGSKLGEWIENNHDLWKSYLKDLKSLHQSAFISDLNFSSEIADIQNGNEPSHPVSAEVTDALKSAEKLDSGQLYQVDIPEDSKLLYYDKPLSEQSDYVKNALKPYMDGSEVFLSANGSMSNPTGKQIYENILKRVDIFDGRNTESVSKLLNELGIPGLRYLDRTSRGNDANNTHNYVVWDESEIQIEGINDKQISEIFNKSEDTTPLEQTGDIPAGSTGAVTAADVVQYIDQGSTGDTVKDKALRKAIHEQFARGFETYLMEGKAPSVELRNVFRTFARWLVEVYRRVKGDLKVDLDAEMRQVFDMMLATEEQIAAADARAQTAPMFTDAAMAGMTEDQWQTYLKQQSKSKDKAAETLRDKLIAQITRQTKSWWKEEKADLVVEETERLKDEPVYRAISTLRDTDLKMDHATAMDMFGEDRVDKRGKKSRHIPGKLRKMTVKGGAGVHPDEAAALLGYGSGAEMIADITKSPTLKEAAEESSEAIMLERHGDILNDGTIQQQADEAVQNEERGKLILQELKALAKGTKIPTLDRMTIKAMAEENIARLSFRQIQPGKYRKAELRAAQEAAVALAKGDKQAATAAKTRQVLNFYLGMAATEARNGTMKIVDRMARYNKKKVREQILKAENGYWEQIVKILQRFEFRKAATLKSVDQTNESLTAWMNERNEVDGAALMITPEVLNELYTSHWKNVPYGTLQGINDSVKNIEHVARYSNKMTMLQDEIDFKKLINRLVDHINEKLPERFPKAQRTTVVSEKGVTRWAASQMSKLPWLFTELDGGERVGLVHEIMMQPFNDAQFAELGMFDEVLSKIYESIEGRSKEDRARHNSTLFIPEIKDENNDGNLKGHQVLAVALNTGNQGNLKKMLLGEGWANPEDETTITRDNPQLQAVLRHMTKNDWELVQLIWDQMQTLYPQLAEVHRKTSGLTPPQVEATPFTVKVKGSLEEIEMNGGYYPVVYDKERSKKARDIAKRDEANVDSLFSTAGSIQASVTAGATNERTGFYGPIKLSLEVVPNHFQEVIHFITHHDAVRQANMIIRNESFREAVKSRLGEDEFNQLEPWLNDIAKAGKNAPVKTFIDAAFSQLRMGTTLGVMGAKVSTGLIQMLGIWNAVGELGVAKTFEGIKLTISKSHVMRAYRSLLGSESDLQTGMEFALEHSKVMKNRIKTMDREMANVFRELESSVDFKADLKGKKGIGAAVDVASTAGINALKALKKSRILRKLQEVSMMHIALIQMYTVDLPSWHAGYSSGLEQWGDEERATRYADFVVENLQGSGNIKDMAMLMRNQGKIHTSFTMFMTFFSTLWNISRDIGRGVKNKRLPATTIAAKLMFVYMVPTLLEMLMRDELFGDEDDEPTDELEEYLLKLAMYPVSSVPFVRDIANGATSGYGYTMNPIAGILEKGVEGGSSAIAAAFDEEKDVTMAQVKNATKLAGAALGVPGVGQIWATGEHLYDVLQEGEDMTLHQLGFGPKRD